MSKIEINMNCSTEEILKQLDKVKQMVVENEVKESNKQKYEEAEKLFLDLINQGLVIKVDGNKVTHYDKNGKWVINQDKEDKVLWLNYHRFWIKFESIFGDSYQEIKVFLNGMVNKHLGLSVYTVDNKETIW